MRTFCPRIPQPFYLQRIQQKKTAKPATVQIIKDRNQDIKSMIVQSDGHLKQQCFGGNWEEAGRCYCSVSVERWRHIASRNILVKSCLSICLRRSDPAGKVMCRMQLPWQARLCPVPSLYKALTKKKNTNETCCMKPLTMSRFGLCWTSSVIFFLTETRRMLTYSQRSRTVCSTCHSWRAYCSLSGSETVRKGGYMSLPPQLSFNPP